MTDTLYESPDCRDSNHHKCNGVGWNETRGGFGDCPCTCHPQNREVTA